MERPRPKCKAGEQLLKQEVTVVWSVSATSKLQPNGVDVRGVDRLRVGQQLCQHYMQCTYIKGAIREQRDLAIVELEEFLFEHRSSLPLFFKAFLVLSFYVVS